MKKILFLLTLGLTGCAGISANYDTPAEARQIQYTVEPITAELVRGLFVAPPASATAPAQKPEQANNLYAYRIGSSDVLSIFINQPVAPRETGNSGQGGESLYNVSENGEIFLPFYGPLKVAGLTTTEAHRKVEQALAKFLAAPQVNLRVSDFRSQRIIVSGAVGRPGPLPITDQAMSITEAVIAAGPDKEANLRRVTLKRGGEDFPVDVYALFNSNNFGRDWIMRNGDVVLVPPNTNRVFVLGEAPNRSEAIDPYSTSLAEVLVGAEASGGQNSANYLQGGTALNGSIFVIRGNIETARVYHLNAASPEAFLLADQFSLADGDIIYVSTRSVTRFNRFISQLLPSLQSLVAPLFIADQIKELGE